MGLFDSILLRFSFGLISFTKKKAIKTLTKKRTRELIAYLEDGPKFDFYISLKRYIELNELQFSIPSIEGDQYYKWTELLKLIVWHKVKDELDYDPTIGSESDFKLLCDVVMQEVNEWEKIIRKRAAGVS